MNLTKLFEMQRELDERIVKEKGLEGQDLLPQKILALQVELGECANEWRGFKFWSKDQQPRTFKGHKATENGIVEINPLLEEYIDCLHFILSIAIDCKIKFGEIRTWYTCDSVQDQFLTIFDVINQIYVNPEVGKYHWDLLIAFIGLGRMLGFTWDQIEEAYMAKNSENHRRQSTGY